MRRQLTRISATLMIRKQIATIFGNTTSNMRRRSRLVLSCSSNVMTFPDSSSGSLTTWRLLSTTVFAWEWSLLTVFRRRRREKPSPWGALRAMFVNERGGFDGTG